MADLSVAAESSETAARDPNPPVPVLLEPTGITATGGDYARAAENAQRIALAFREQTAQQQGNATG